VVGERQERGLVPAKLAEAARGVSPLVEGSKDVVVELRHLLPELFDLASVVDHAENLTLGERPVIFATMGRVGISRDMAGELRDKYAEMLAMRIEHDGGSEDPARVRPRMVELASRFPGALREIDALELGEIRRRIAALEGFLEGRGEEQGWMEAMALFHRLMRGALGAKRWLAGRRDVDGEIAQAYRMEMLGLAFPEECHEWAGELALIAAPPRGRLMDVVFARVARRLGTTDVAARLLVFGS
jgi:hypothetical protein